jgi:DNA-binding beta-propeller fold protein YncE
MRKHTVMGLLVAALVAGRATAQEPVQSERLTKLWETKEGLKTPESVLFDPKDNVLYVSNVNEKPWEKDGNGFISKLSAKGDFIAVKWATGLSAPKGMGIAKGKLYVTDIDELVEIDLATAKATARYTVDGAKNLNDVATGPDGAVYVSDSAGRSVFVLKKGKLEPLTTTEDLAHVNGLLVTKAGLMVGLPNSLGTFDLKTKAVKTTAADTGGIDGIVAVGDGRFVISDWAGKVQLLQSGQPAVVLLDTTPKKVNAADIDFIAADKTLLVPTFFDDKVVAYRLK